MSSIQDFLTILLAVELFVITACVVVVTYFSIRVLKSFSRLAESFGKIKTFIPLPALLVAIVSRIFKRGR